MVKFIIFIPRKDIKAFLCVHTRIAEVTFTKNCKIKKIKIVLVVVEEPSHRKPNNGKSSTSELQCNNAAWRGN